MVSQDLPDGTVGSGGRIKDGQFSEERTKAGPRKLPAQVCDFMGEGSKSWVTIMGATNSCNGVYLISHRCPGVGLGVRA